MTRNRPNLGTAHRQDGVALIIGLLLLVVMSLLGLSMMGTTNLETMMAGGARESGIAHQAAEAALRDAETKIGLTTSIAVDFDGSTDGQLDEDTLEPDLFAAATWVNTNSQKYSHDDYPEMPAGGQPRYILKHMGTVDFAAPRQQIAQLDEGEHTPLYVDVFRATARGTSRDGSAITLLQSYFGRKY